MKIYLLLFALISLSFANGQTTKVTYNRTYPEFPSCKKAENLKLCFEEQLHSFVNSNIKESDIKTIISRSIRDTISITSEIHFTQSGKINKTSSINFSRYKDKIDLNYLINKLPIIKPQTDIYDHPVALNVYHTLYFKIDRKQQTIEKLLFHEPNIVNLNIIENVPVYPGCNPKSSNKILKKCLSSKIGKLISKNFNFNVITKSNLPKGLLRIYATFKIDKKGYITDIDVKAPKRKLKKETIRVIKLIPKMTKPGYQRNKPVKVPFSIPINFKI